MLTEALARLDDRLPLEVPVLVGDDEGAAGGLRVDRPGHARPRIVATAGRAGAAEADAAVEAATAVAPAWARHPGRGAGRDARRAPPTSCARHRLDLAALEVRECAKPWAEADADVCEAIDFLEYYARQAVELERAPELLQVPRRAQHDALRGARRRGRDRALELPDRDPVRDDGRGARGRATRSC